VIDPCDCVANVNTHKPRRDLATNDTNNVTDIIAGEYEDSPTKRGNEGTFQGLTQYPPTFDSAISSDLPI